MNEAPDRSSRVRYVVIPTHAGALVMEVKREIMAGIEAIVYDHTIPTVQKSHIWERANALATHHAEYGSAIKSLATNRKETILLIENAIDACEKTDERLVIQEDGIGPNLYAAKKLTTTEKGINIDGQEIETDHPQLYEALWVLKNIHLIAFPHDIKGVEEKNLPDFIGSRLTDDMLEMAALKLQKSLDLIDDWLERENIKKKMTDALSQFEKKNNAFLKTHKQLLRHLCTVKKFSYDKEKMYMDDITYPTSNGFIYNALWTLKTFDASTHPLSDLKLRTTDAITVLKEWGKTKKPTKT